MHIVTGLPVCAHAWYNTEMGCGGEGTSWAACWAARGSLTMDHMSLEEVPPVQNWNATQSTGLPQQTEAGICAWARRGAVRSVLITTGCIGPCSSGSCPEGPYSPPGP